MPKRPDAEKGTLTPRYLPTHIVYAPPGRNSSMAYSKSAGLGSTISVSDSQGRTMKIGATMGAGVPMIAKVETTISWGQSWGTTRADAIDFSTTETSGYRKAGKDDPLSSDEDEIWFLVKPVIEVTAVPESYYGPADISWAIVATQQLTPYFLYVGELNGRWPMPQSVRQQLDRWGFTARDLTDLLSGHPFPYGSSPNQAMDPVRFEFLGQYPYRAAAQPGSAPSSQSYDVTRKTVNSSSLQIDIGYSFDVTVTGSATFLKVLSAGFNFATGSSVKLSTSTKTAITDEQRSTMTLVQPAFGYTGPTVVRVWQDKVFKSLYFTPDWY